MVGQHCSISKGMLAAVAVSLAVALPCLGHGGGGHGGGGHGGGGGHAIVHGGAPACSFRGGMGYRGFHGYRGFYGYPGWYGPGLGLGIGYGLGLGYGGYGYGFGYPYYPYTGGYPVYVSPGYGPAPAACPVATQAPVASGLNGPAANASIRLTDADMLLSIRVPPDAAVRINGATTNQSGSRREFLSSGLAPGRTYTFIVTARWTGPDGQAVEREKRVQVQGGERRYVDFLIPPLTAQAPH